MGQSAISASASMVAGWLPRRSSVRVKPTSGTCQARGLPVGSGTSARNSLGTWFSADGMRLVVLHHAPLNHPHRLLSWETSNPVSEPTAVDAARLNEFGLADPAIQSVANLLGGETPHAGPTRAQKPAWSRGLAFTHDGRFAVFGPGDGTFEVLCTQTAAKVAIGGLDDQRARVLLFFPTFEASVDQHVDHLITGLGRMSGKSGLVVRRASKKEIRPHVRLLPRWRGDRSLGGGAARSISC